MKVQLVDIAHARSGDKGDTANVGVIALRPEWYPLIAESLTRARVAQHFAGGRPKVEEVVAYWPALVDKTVVTPRVEVST